MVDNISDPLCGSALNEAVDGFLYSYVASKLYTPSVIKQFNSKGLSEAYIVPFPITCCSFIMMARDHFKCMASSLGNSTFYLINTA